MSATSSGGWQAVFKEACSELNYGRRCSALSVVGKSLAQESSSKQLVEELKGLAGDTFSALSVLTVLQKADLAGVANALLGHPSQAVRLRAVRLLDAADAEKAFLSGDSSQQTKMWLVRSCPSLPCSTAVLEHADKIFPQQVVWLVLKRTSDERVFSDWSERLKGLFSGGNVPPGLSHLAVAFPDSVLQLLEKGRLSRLSWDWVLPLAQQRPKRLLEVMLATKSSNKEWVQKKLIQWCWRHQHHIMLKYCEDVSKNSIKGQWPALSLLELQQSIVSSHSCPTVMRKIDTIVSVFSGLPENEKTAAKANKYIELMPKNIEAHRSKELARLVSAYWQVVTDLGRGKLEQAANDGLFAALARRLPPPLAVEQFFRVCQDVDPVDSVYLLVQSDICRSQDGRHDTLMQQVFEKYLSSRREGRQVADCVKVFQVLLNDVVSMDVLQTSFEALTAQRLKGATERTLFKDVVSRMKSLDAWVTRAKRAAEVVPEPVLPLPTSWLRFMPFPENAPPHVAFLHGALAAWAADPAALAQAVERFGTALFWSTLENVLLHALGQASETKLQWPKDKIEFAVFKEVAVVMPAARSVHQQPTSGSAAEPSVPAAAVPDGYFSNLEAKKGDTFNRDSQVRLDAYSRLINEGRQEPDSGRVLDDLIPFVATRLGGEQEDVRFRVTGQLLNAGFPIALWAERLGDLRKLWAAFSKSRGRAGANWRSWTDMGSSLVQHELATWKSDQKEAGEACTFGVELAQNQLNWGGLFRQLWETKVKAAEDPNEEAIRWLLRTAVPQPAARMGVLIVGDAASQNPLKDFCELLTLMASTAHSTETALWERWSFLREWWETLLGRGVSLGSAEFLLAGVVEYWINHQTAAAAQHTALKKFWWVPLECEAYKKAVQSVLLQIETGEIPFVEGAQMLAARSQRVQQMEAMTRLGRTVTTPSASFGQPLQRWWMESPMEITRLHPDKGLDAELGVLAKLVDMAMCPRSVYWSVLLAVSGLQGSTSDDLLRKVIFSLDARKEGMARCVAVQFPYLNTALAPTDSPTGNSDLLTAALEMWLHSVENRDARVAELMSREDAECLLFFGSYFAEHVSRCRQEFLHQCLEKIRAPSQEAELAEFYWHTDKIPSLARVAQFSKGWRRLHSPHCPQGVGTPQAILTFFWHPSTQAEFLQKGLVNTEMNTLAVIPALEYVDGVGHAGELLEQHPREQKGELNDSSWTIIQPSGTFQSVWEEVEKRFSELDVPVGKNSISDREADQLLVNLGRADHADNALKILGKYATKFKQAKEALVLAVRNLSPSHARRVIQEVCFDKDAGISLQVAALRLVGDLQVPSPLDLYRTAWRNGVCHRDIAANILVKVATSPVADWTPEEVRDMFEIFSGTSANKSARVDDGIPVPAGKKYPEGTYQRMSTARKENLPYVADILTGALCQVHVWSLPFLPEVMVKVAFLPGCTQGALNALRANTNLVTEVVAAFTAVLREARLAALLSGVSAGKRQKAGAEPLSNLLAQLSECGPGKSQSISAHTRTLNLSACDQQTLRSLVGELLMAHVAQPKSKKSEETDALKDALGIWVRALRTDGGADAWATTLQEMEQEVLSVAGLEHLTSLAKAVLDHVASLSLNRVQDGPWLFPVLKGFMTRLVQHFPPQEEMSPYYEDIKEKIVKWYWARIVGHGSPDADTDEFWRHRRQDNEVGLCLQVVSVATGHLWWAGSKEEKQADRVAAEKASHKVLKSLELCFSPAKLPLGPLAEMWPQVLESDKQGEILKVALGVFDRRPSMLHCVMFAEEVLSRHKEQRHLQLMTLRWLGGIFPREAVRLWPAALRARDAAACLQELLEFCVAKGLEPPEMPKEVLSNKAALVLMAQSPLPQARMCAVKGLRELDLRDKAKDQAVFLDTLREDACVSVSVAARIAWQSIFGNEGETTS